MKPEIITALDLPTSRAMRELLDKMPPELEWYKLGLELFCAEGPSALAPLKELDKNIFLDLKLHDIPRTVANAVRSASQHGVQMLTLHAGGGSAMLAAAVEAAAEFGEFRPRLLAVTVLTSLDRGDLQELGVSREPREQVLALGRLAIAAGVDGLVCSPQEVGALRRELGPGPLLVTPGIRLPADSVGDQKRIATPADAARDGASHLVIGRPITAAPDPLAALERIRADLDAAVAE
jgi:orotidine-5'-phosphate decarboxylase